MATRFDTSSQPIVYVIDDDDSFRASIVRAVSLAGFKGIGYSSSGAFLLDQVRDRAHEAPSCMLLDISMPGPSGIELMRAMAERDDAPPIIFVTARDDIVTSVDMMKCGALDYLLKPVSLTHLMEVIERALGVDAQRRRMRIEANELAQRFDSLTEAERCVFDGVVQHQLNKQLAFELNVCERTVKTLRSHMMDKMSMTSIPEIVRASMLIGRLLGRGRPAREQANASRAKPAANGRAECRA